MELPRRNGEVQSLDAHGKTLNVKRIKRGTYFARIRGEQHARWGNADQIQEDVEHFKEHGTLPYEKGGFQGLAADRVSIPRPSTKVRFNPTAASLALYTDHPRVGETGRVTKVSLGRRSSHYLPGPGGGLLYVQWENKGTLGVSLLDVEKV